MTALFAGAGLCSATESVESMPGLEAYALDPRSQSEGKTLFTKLDPKALGISMVNEYADSRMWNELYNEFALGAIGTGVAVADYDKDGNVDLFLVNKTGQSQLYRNLGDWRFEQVTEQAGLGEKSGGWLDSVSGWFGSDDKAEGESVWKQGAAFADVDNDGWLDLYVCRFDAPNQLFINQGDGTFLEAEGGRGLDLTSASGMGHFCDFNRDGWLDVYVQTNMLDARKSPEGSRDRLYLNTGDGYFEDVTEQAGVSGKTLGHSATWWDYDEDGWPDLLVANDFAAPDQLYRNECANGEIRFVEVVDQVVRRQTHSSMGADLGDVNNDGHIDVLVAEMAPTDHEMDMRGMGVTRYTMRDVNEGEEGAPQFMFNVLHLNTGLGVTMEAAWLAGLARTDWTWSVRFEDLDCDGLIDLHVTNGMVREFQNDDLRQRIFRAEHPSARMRIMNSSPVMQESNLAFRNLGDLRFERVERDWGLDEVGVSFG
ncbi:VCBS repeat-containing protein, partial [Pelagicoccus sp. SDUM812003]|uniref:FG-GAP repeat domain-containing protein n=1 Tax=Pelagicoccus sp. SDUM812003 TaxID=3041267 RepID=UPI0028100D63